MSALGITFKKRDFKPKGYYTRQLLLKPEFRA